MSAQERGIEQEVVPPAGAPPTPPEGDPPAHEEAAPDEAAAGGVEVGAAGGAAAGDAEDGGAKDGAGADTAQVATPQDGAGENGSRAGALAAQSAAGADQAPPRPDGTDARSEAGDAQTEAQDEPDADADADDDHADLHERAGKADAYLELAQRTQADFDNYRKRMTREVRAAESRGIGRLARELLPAIDNLERALAAVDAAEPRHHLSEGIRLVTAELSAALGRTGIQGYDPKGERFDPAQHEAVAQHPVAGAEPGTVVEVLQAGYRLNEAILRPARVIVAS